MATNKNQHFVPRCYLRQFCVEGSDRAINLFNIDRLQLVENAPVKHQCSRDYFYGKNPQLEKAIQTVEGTYGDQVRLMLQRNYKLTNGHRELLRIFWLMQYLRTEAASRRSVEMSKSMHAVLGKEAVLFSLQMKEAVQIAMQTFAESMDIVSDLKVCLVRNRTTLPFVTSDDPAILTNRWHLHNARKTGRSFGLHSAGNILLLPLSPEILCIGYDSDVHGIAHSDGWVDSKNELDVNALNQHQYLNCRANIFLRDAASFQPVKQGYIDVAASRLTQRHRAHYAVKDCTVGDYTRYVVVDQDNVKPQEIAFVHTEVKHAAPTVWPSFLSWRNGARVYTNGTGVGYVRKRFTDRETHRPFRRMQAFLS